MKKILLITLLFLGVTTVFNSCKEDPKKDEPIVDIIVPVLTTIEATDIKTTSAKVAGTISSNSGSEVTERGFCWSELPNPNINNDTLRNGKGLGSYSSTIMGLTKATKYYIKAYAINANGIGYGNEISITTENIVIESVTFNGKKIYLSPSDNGKAIWGPIATTGATSNSDGKSNTAKLVAIGSQFAAAKLCNDLDAFGFSDWYLPSRDQLEAIYNNVDDLETISLNSTSYWTSTERDSKIAYFKPFMLGGPNSNLKERDFMCRCVRED